MVFKCLNVINHNGAVLKIKSKLPAAAGTGLAFGGSGAARYNVNQPSIKNGSVRAKQPISYVSCHNTRLLHNTIWNSQRLASFHDILWFLSGSLDKKIAHPLFQATRLQLGGKRIDLLILIMIE